jgi:hypothetical protein
MILYIGTLGGRNADFIDITFVGPRGAAGGRASGAAAPGRRGQGAAKRTDE